MSNIENLNSNNIHFLLKKNTEEIHKKLEEINPLGKKLPSLNDYIKFLSVTAKIVIPLELKLHEILKIFEQELKFELRMKTTYLQKDLCALEINIDYLKEQNYFPIITNIAQGLGVMYVLEGSTLGSQMLYKKLTSIHGSKLSHATNYLLGNAHITYPLWKEFLTFLNEYNLKNENQTDFIIQAAIETFHCFEKCFSNN